MNDPADRTPIDAGNPFPSAILRSNRGTWLAWLVPLAALAFAGFLFSKVWAGRGETITVELDQGHGLQPGDDVRYRGIAIGTVESVDLDDDGVVIEARLKPSAEALACSGSRFWVVRPQLGFTGVAGLETIIGPRYLAILPGKGPAQRNFVGMAQPPVVERIAPGDLTIVLEAPRRSGLRAGAPLMYRQIRVGTVLSVELASDGGSVEARAVVEGPFTTLVRQKSRWWTVGGLTSHVGVTGVTIELESIETLIAGGVALATPPDAGEVVEDGHRFKLELEAVKDALDWKPLTSIGTESEAGRPRTPVPMRASLRWKQGRFFATEQLREGWVLQLDQGLLGPLDLLTVPDKARKGSVALEVSTQAVAVESGVAWSNSHLALLATRIHDRPWPREQMRRASAPEDCLVITDPKDEPLPLSAARLTADADLWKVDSAVPIDVRLHGASVVARSDGSVVGVLLADAEGARIALLTDEVIR